MAKDFWEELDNSKYPAIANLVYWSTNYDFGQGPWQLFLDLIGYSDQELDVRLYDGPGMDAISRSYIIAALQEYDKEPNQVWDYITYLDHLELEAS